MNEQVFDIGMRSSATLLQAFVFPNMLGCAYQRWYPRTSKEAGSISARLIYAGHFPVATGVL